MVIHSTLLIVFSLGLFASGSESATDPTAPVNVDLCKSDGVPMHNNVLRKKNSCVVQVEEKCLKAIWPQVDMELNAAFNYLQLAGMFDSEAVAKPGLAKFLYEAASEERQHAISMLEYIDRRGYHIHDTTHEEREFKFDATKFPTLPDVTDSDLYENTLRSAVVMEEKVTNAINEIVKACSTDFDGADFFTAPILAEQFTGMRALRGALAQLQDLKDGNTDRQLAEYIIDQRILKNGL